MSFRLRLLASLTAGVSITGAYFIDHVDPFAPQLRPYLFQLFDPETAHYYAVKMFRYGFFPHEGGRVRPYEHWDGLNIKLWNLNFRSPVGLAAGFDKDGEAIDGLLRSGFSFVEIGSVTPKAQAGNPKPRVFRLPEHEAVINRYGFNSLGAYNAYDRLRSRYYSPIVTFGFGEYLSPGVVGVNIGKNKESEVSAAQDFVEVTKRVVKYVDYLVINVSSPNTPGLRDLQVRKELEEIVYKVVEARNSTLEITVEALKRAKGKEEQSYKRLYPPLLIKISPDLSDEQLQELAKFALDNMDVVDGIIISNTTTSRPPEVENHPLAKEKGGLSGRPLFEPSTKTLSRMYELTKGKIVLIGCGGVFSGADAYAKIRAGASLVQMYTAVIYHGPKVVTQVKTELAELLKKDGYKCVADAVGADHRQKLQTSRWWKWSS